MVRILVTNDDGVDSPGIWTMVRQLRPFAEVTVVAPWQNMSGCSLATLYKQPIRLQRTSAPWPDLAVVPAYGVQSTPASCVLLALRELTGPDVDLVISGINDVPNVSRDILLSGTVGAAFFAHLHDVPAMAVSVATIDGVVRDWLPSATVAAALAGHNDEWRHLEALLNVNVPNLPLDQMRGWCVTSLSHSIYAKTVQLERDSVDPDARRYQLAVWNPDVSQQGSDEWALERGYVSVTPVHADLSDGRARFPLERCVDGFKPFLSRG